MGRVAQADFDDFIEICENRIEFAGLLDPLQKIVADAARYNTTRNNRLPVNCSQSPPFQQTEILSFEFSVRTV